jgi:hypothetical protein
MSEHLAMNDLFLTLEAAKSELREKLGKGARCPCCSQFAKIYKRRITSRQARGIIVIYRKAGTNWAHVPTLSPVLFGDSAEVSKLRYWKLIEESSEVRDDGGRAGWWRITALGACYVNDRITVPKYACIYDSRLLKLEGELVGIRDALGKKFNYYELMGTVPSPEASSLAAGMIAKNTGTSSVAGSPATSMSD